MVANTSPSPWPVVSSAAVATVLLDARRRRFLEPFFGQERTVKAAAQELGIKPNSLLYQVERLMSLGLLVVSRLEPRAGRAVRHYRVASERFFVPFGATDSETLEALLLKTAQPRAELFARNFARVLRSTPSGGMGYLVGRHEHGEVEAYFSPDGVRTWSLWEKEAPAAGRSWMVVNLDHEAAKALQREQWALWERYLEMGGSGRYLMHFDLTPILDER